MDVSFRLHSSYPAVIQGSSGENILSRRPRKLFNCLAENISEYLLASESVLHVDAHEAPDEVLGLLADVVPVGRVKLKLT